MNGMNNTIVIFGGTGDLTYRKLMPALYNLYQTNKLGKDRIIAIGRRKYTNEEYHKIIYNWIERYARMKFNSDLFNDFIKQVDYYEMDFTNHEEYIGLIDYFNGKNLINPIFYYAVAPQYFCTITDGITASKNCCDGKVIIEKPFGNSLEEARRLSKKLEDSFGSENIYRIDHYLGKEMIRNIESIRFDNLLFANSWNFNSIENIQIQALEEVGVETRGSYYDHAGALKDMVQNHLMQILTLVAMERPNDLITIQDRQIEVLKALRPVNQLDIQDSLILAQYEGYKDEDNVSKDSKTETYAAMKLFIDTPRWKGIPFYIKTGKKTGSREMNVIVTFKKSSSFVEANKLVIKIQPLEGISLKFNMKEPGESEDIVQTEMDFCQSCISKNRINTPEAYERLLFSCIQGDQSWFSKWDQILLSWEYIEELKESYLEKECPIYTYKQDTPGPDVVNRLLNDVSHEWEESQLYCKLQESDL
ncbi:MAG: glucose-6-phosphate dehydrogenase, partial [Anaerorhabdus sp.]